MPAAMYRFRNMPMRTSKCARIQCPAQDPRPRSRLREVDIGNTCGAAQRQNPLALYQDFKQPQHACASETLATPGVAFAKMGSNTTLLWGVHNLETVCGTLKGPRDFPEFATRLGEVSLLSFWWVSCSSAGDAHATRSRETKNAPR